MATSVLDKCGVCRGNGSSCILNKGHTAGDKRNFIKTSNTGHCSCVNRNSENAFLIVTLFM